MRQLAALFPSTRALLVQTTPQHFGASEDGSYDRLPDWMKLQLLATKATGSTATHGAASRKEGQKDAIHRAGSKRRCVPLRDTSRPPFQAVVEEEVASQAALPFLPLWRLRASRFDLHHPPDCTHSSFQGNAFDAEFVTLYDELRRMQRAPTQTAELPAPQLPAPQPPPPFHRDALERLAQCSQLCVVQRRKGRLPEACRRWADAGAMTSAALRAFEADRTMTCGAVRGAGST